MNLNNIVCTSIIYTGRASGELIGVTVVTAVTAVTVVTAVTTVTAVTSECLCLNLIIQKREYSERVKRNKRIEFDPLRVNAFLYNNVQT